VAKQAAGDFAAIVVADDNVGGLRVDASERGLVERGEPAGNHGLRPRVTLRGKSDNRGSGHAPVPPAGSMSTTSSE